MLKNTQTYRKAITAASLVVLISAQSCKKSFLDVPVQAQTTSSTFFTSATDAAQAVNSIYANLRSFNQVAFPAIAVESMGSDDAEKGSTAGDATFMNLYDTFTETATETQLTGFWTGLYVEINLCNQVLDNVPNITMDASLKARYLAEAKFVRAYSYFRLVRAFGGVPLRLHVPTGTDQYNISRSTAAQVYAAVEQDLTDAASVLPTSYGSDDVGRATKGAALALHAKVAMYLKKWTDVYNYTTQVMGMGYSLFPNFEQLFRIANENSSESVFEIQCATISTIANASTSQYSQVQGARQSGGGWGFNVPTSDLSNAFATGDPRRDATILYRGETTPGGDVVLASNPNPMYNQKSYVPFTTAFVSNEGEAQNVRVIRYAEVLLMNAEAANELGNITQALASLEMVRARARGSNSSILPKVTTTDQSALRTAIWNERRYELAMEFDRFFDVIRQGRGAAVFGSKGFVTGKSELMPIPQTEIDLSGGVLTQNPGY
ncbi:RagB/SusD family nutrient uptake outer membrane protein [Mucilaginibacter robiniae]|uniref:RagB/SusD family nutrient uptake outer membrane protein n=1 Tax=Mucilaginibacter robiniae TaxID=2728022 RepID=A0A7L5E7F5_9SPHI|nr:RagB/SusD family nutrient uptake outer membrane protein [Mucilaginibacter robiniae]QJD97744.1 RagB/SusD family nutrient uptake outer membrane protein [Mucilaginibacter robiniae]